MIVALIALVGLGTGYLLGSDSVQSRTATIVGTTTLTRTDTSSLTATSTVTSTTTATWMETNYFPVPSTGEPISWNRTTSYPLPVVGLSCVTSADFAYCVGGFNETAPRGPGGAVNETYFAPVSPTGTGQWMRTADYPLLIARASCVSSAGYIYCVGGLAGPDNNVTADVFFAPLSPSGIGTWEQTTSFPNPIGVPPCVVDSSYVYCVTQNATGPFLPAGDTYFAHLSAAGVGSWTESSQNPSSPVGCAASGGYVYCFGSACPALPSPCTVPSYYAPLSPDGVGNWTLTSDLPTAFQSTYVSAAGAYEYYFTATNTLVANLSSSGIGSWIPSTAYPEDDPAGCFSYGVYVYCVGSDITDFTPSQNVYFTRVG
jgi:hypothetical protein